MSRDDQSGSGFGQRGPAADTPKPAGSGPSIIVLIVVGLCLGGVVAGVVGWALPMKQAAEQEQARTRQSIIDIVNQPVTHLPRTDEAAVFSPGWFHPGAVKPDFATVDVRQTQQLIYDQNNYVTSDLNPNEMFIGRELEFNAMTKYFYVDRTLPKKRLTDGEMGQINGLYRVLARDEKTLGTWWLTAGGLAAVVSLLGVAALFVPGRRA